MIYEELANEKISIFGYSEPLVPYEKAMEACRELVKERKKALERIRELTVENAMLEQRNADVARLTEERDGLVPERDNIDARR